MADSADARDLKSRVGNSVRVQVPLPAPYLQSPYLTGVFFFSQLVSPFYKKQSDLKSSLAVLS